ncbi:MAG: ABC transporter ATP-binding protein [Gemmatimonadetes bacterium]|nr:ABC transporter ATP-binding protein [Gemmatimonadota bacterium]
MPSPQAYALLAHAARTLGVDVPHPPFQAAGARVAATPDELLEQVIAAGRGLPVSFLARVASREAVAPLVADRAFPFVLAGPAIEGEVPALVFTGAEGRGFVAWRVGPAGDDERLVGSLDEHLARLAPGGRGLRLLTAVAVGSVATPTDTRELPVAGAAHAPPRPVERLFALLARERREIAIVYVYAALVGLFSLALPLGVQSIINLISGGLILQPVVLLIVFVVGGSLASGVLQLMQLAVVETIQQRVFARMALEFAYRVPRLELERVLGESLPEQMNRFFEALTIEKSLAKLLTDMTAALLSIVLGLVLLTFYHPSFTLAGVLLALGLWVTFALTGRTGLDTSLVESKYKYRLVHWFEDVARAVTAFKFAGRSGLALARTDALLAGWLTYRRRHFRVLVWQGAAAVLFKVLVTALLLVLGSVLVVRREISLGQFVASELIIVTVLGAVEKLLASMATIYDVLTAVEKAGHVTDLPLERTGGRAPAPDTAPAAVTLTDVSYTYPGARSRALSRVTLHVAPGERVAITGFDGAGQSTLLRVMTGLLAGYEGSVAWDGVSLRELDAWSLRAHIGQMLHGNDLVDASVLDNVALGRPDVRPEDVLAALEAVGLGDWIRALPQGLATPIVASGSRLPSSVAARLLVARAIAGRPRLVVADDVLGHAELEPRTAITRLLTDRARPWTLVVATHDPALLAACDRVIVLRDGAVARAGTPAECAEDPWARPLLDGAAGASRAGMSEVA